MTSQATTSNKLPAFPMIDSVAHVLANVNVDKEISIVRALVMNGKAVGFYVVCGICDQITFDSNDKSCSWQIELITNNNVIDKMYIPDGFSKEAYACNCHKNLNIFTNHEHAVAVCDYYMKNYLQKTDK